MSRVRLEATPVDVEIARQGEGLRVSLRRGEGPPDLTHDAKVDFSEVAAFAEALREAAGEGRPIGGVIAASGKIHRAIFQGALNKIVEQSLDAPTVLRLKLHDAELHSIPWEALHDPELGFLGMSDDVVTVRVVDVPDAPAAVPEAPKELTEIEVLTPSRVAARLAASGADATVDYLFRTNHPDARLIESIITDSPEHLVSVRRWAFEKFRESAVTFAPVAYVRASAPVSVQPGIAAWKRLRGGISLVAPKARPASADALPSARGELYPHVTSKPVDEIEPDQIVTFVLRLDPTGPSGLAPIGVQFPEGAEQVALLATVSSATFVCPEGESWQQTFTVDRRLATVPSEWELRAKALGDHPLYALTVSFDVADTPAGAYEVRLRRKGAPELPGGHANGGIVRIPRAASEARLVFKITAEGLQYRLRLRRGGVDTLDEPILWAMGTDLFFTRLEAAKGVEDIRSFGWALAATLPAAVRAALDDRAMDGLPLLIESGTPVAPFELLRLRPRENGPHLGIDRPVLRWIDDLPMPDVGVMHVTGAACIRPDYAPSDALPNAKDEEREFRLRLSALAFDHVGTLAELDALLLKPTVQLVHFAGHADGNPAKLALEDTKVDPAHFDPGTPLMNAGPFLFLNGCRAAAGRTQVPEFQANMLKMLLTANCTGAVAPLTKVESDAARTAAGTFYKAVAEGKTVGEAVMAVRALAFEKGADPKNVVSYLSYLAFASPGLRLSW